MLQRFADSQILWITSRIWRIRTMHLRLQRRFALQVIKSVHLLLQMLQRRHLPLWPSVHNERKQWLRWLLFLRYFKSTLVVIDNNPNQVKRVRCVTRNITWTSGSYGGYFFRGIISKAFLSFSLTCFGDRWKKPKSWCSQFWTFNSFNCWAFGWCSNGSSGTISFHTNWFLFLLSIMDGNKMSIIFIATDCFQKAICLNPLDDEYMELIEQHKTPASSKRHFYDDDDDELTRAVKQASWSASCCGLLDEFKYLSMLRKAFRYPEEPVITAPAAPCVTLVTPQLFRGSFKTIDDLYNRCQLTPEEMSLV